nr:16S rRNA (guanine(966)-N(2))-methyltransferase RsmD [uncultured Mailhella sp.]
MRQSPSGLCVPRLGGEANPSQAAAPKIPRPSGRGSIGLKAEVSNHKGSQMRIIAGACRGRVLHTVSGPGYRPAMGKVRESLFSMLEARGVVWGAVRFLDVFAGSGSLGFEALSRGAVWADFIEMDHKAAECLRKNAAALDLTGRCAVLEDDALRVAARRPSAPYHIICVDPPYGAGLFKPVLRNLMRQGWLEDEGFLIAEIEKGLTINPDAQYDLRLEAERLYGNTRILVWVKNA